MYTYYEVKKNGTIISHLATSVVELWVALELNYNCKFNIGAAIKLSKRYTGVSK